VNFFT